MQHRPRPDLSPPFACRSLPTAADATKRGATKGFAGLARGASRGVAPDPQRFLGDVGPLLARQDTAGLLRLLSARYSSKQIDSLLNGPCADVRKVAALALSLVGDMADVPALARRLRDPDPTVNAMAEHALWSIWFRGGSPEANAHLIRGSETLHEGDPLRAIEHFTAAICVCPQFAEAYNQRAIAFYLRERFGESLNDGRRAVELMPCHFGAWAGMGHCLAHRGELGAALNCYRRALAINAHSHGVADMIRELKSRCAPVGKTNGRSDAWLTHRPQCKGEHNGHWA